MYLDLDMDQYTGLTGSDERPKLVNEMKTQTFLFRVKKGKERTLLRWGTEVTKHHWATAISTLREEGRARESFVIFRARRGSFAAFVSDHRGALHPINMRRPINQKHRKILHSCLEYPGVRGESAYNLFVPLKKS